MTTVTDLTLRSFAVHVPDEDLADLRRGGHFAAWEEPGLFTEELRAGFRSLR